MPWKSAAICHYVSGKAYREDPAEVLEFDTSLKFFSVHQEVTFAEYGA